MSEEAYRTLPEMHKLQSNLASSLLHRLSPCYCACYILIPAFTVYVKQRAIPSQPRVGSCAKNFNGTA